MVSPGANERSVIALAESFSIRFNFRMGSKRLDSISDYSRHGFNLRVVCQECGRSAVLDSLALSMARTKASKSRDMGAIERGLKCRAWGSREVKCGPVELLAGEH
jgi:hypothetical protein